MFNDSSAYVPRHARAGYASDSPTVADRIARTLAAGGAALGTLAGAPPVRSGYVPDPCANTADCNRAGEPYGAPRELAESERWHMPAGEPAELIR